ncbi:MAG: alpha/beta hydrolase family protein [Alcanivorax sp.]
MRKNLTIDRDDGTKIQAEYFVPEPGTANVKAPLVIMAHSFPKNLSGKGELFDELGEMISGMGVRAMTFEYSHSVNVSAEDQKFDFNTAAKDFESILNWAAEKKHRRVAFITEGLGAPIVFMNMPDNAMFTILCWPAFDLQQVKNELFKAPKYQDDLDRNGFLNVAGNIISKELLDQLEHTDLTPYLDFAYSPTMALHGVKDTVFPIQHLDIAREKLMVPRFSITSFDDGEAGLKNPKHKSLCLHHIREFIDKHQYRDLSDEAKAEIKKSRLKLENTLRAKSE